jgi:hypothetical protein
MPQPLRLVAQHTLTIDLGDGTQIPLGTFSQDQDGQLDNGTCTGGYLELRVDGHYYGALTFSAETGKPVIGLAQYELAMDQAIQVTELDGTATEPEG